MKTISRWVGTLALAGFTMAAVSADEWILPPGETTLKPGEQTGLVTAQCMICHSADYISTQPPLKRASWEAIVVKMREKYGAPLPPDKVQAVVDYLAANYGSK